MAADRRLIELLEAWQRADDDHERAECTGQVRAHLAQPGAQPPDRTALEAAANAQEAGDAAEAERILRAHFTPHPPREALPVTQIMGGLPAPLLWARGQGGAVVSEGTVCVLSGEGGIAKSALAMSVALGVGAVFEPKDEMPGELFEGEGGPILLSTFEDSMEVCAWRLRKLAEEWGNWRHPERRERVMAGLGRVHVLDLSARPLFGPHERKGHYNARPGPLMGWSNLWKTVDRIAPRLIIIDPVFSAYVGESGADAPVREFLSALSAEARKRQIGVLLVAHAGAMCHAAPEKTLQSPNPFDHGRAGGSGAWTGATRGALEMTWRRDKEAGERWLSVTNAHYGPTNIAVPLRPIRHKESAAILGFEAGGPWTSRAP